MIKGITKNTKYDDHYQKNDVHTTKVTLCPDGIYLSSIFSL